MNRFISAVIRLGLLLILCAQFSLGQAVYGNINGTVTDASGAVVGNATVTITDLDRGATYKITANASGNYEQTHLLAGHYKVSVTAPGFSAFEATAEVQIDSSTRVDAALGVQGQSTQVVVTGETPLLKVDRADVSTTLSTEELGSLPILNRNLTQMLLVTPGTQINDWSHAQSENPQGGYQIDVNGQQFTANGFPARRYGKQQLDSRHCGHQSQYRLPSGIQGHDERLRCRVRLGGRCIDAGHNEIRHEPVARFTLRIFAKRQVQRQGSILRRESAAALEPVRCHVWWTN